MEIIMRLRGTQHVRDFSTKKTGGGKNEFLSDTAWCQNAEIGEADIGWESSYKQGIHDGGYVQLIIFYKNILVVLRDDTQTILFVL